MRTRVSITASELLKRIQSLHTGPQADVWNYSSLLNAYIACLSFDELCNAIQLTLKENFVIRQALRNRLLRLLRAGCDGAHLTVLRELIEETVRIAQSDRMARKATDPLHSAVISFLPEPTQQLILDHLRQLSTADGMNRWLRAEKSRGSSFNYQATLSYWRLSRDDRAAKLLAYQASPEHLKEIIHELAEQCGEAWIVGRAILRSSTSDDGVWEIVRQKHPATYLYLCACLNRNVADEEAFALAEQSRSNLHPDGERGLAIWSIGQMGKLEILDRIRDCVKQWDDREFRERYASHLGEAN